MTSVAYAIDGFKLKNVLQSGVIHQEMNKICVCNLSAEEYLFYVNWKMK